LSNDVLKAIVEPLRREERGEDIFYRAEPVFAQKGYARQAGRSAKALMPYGIAYIHPVKDDARFLSAVHPAERIFFSGVPCVLSEAPHGRDRRAVIPEVCLQCNKNSK